MKRQQELGLVWAPRIPGGHWQCFRCMKTDLPEDKRTTLEIHGQGTAPVCKPCGNDILVCLERGTSAPIAFPVPPPDVSPELRAKVDRALAELKEK